MGASYWKRTPSLRGAVPHRRACNLVLRIPNPLLRSCKIRRILKLWFICRSNLSNRIPLKSQRPRLTSPFNLRVRPDRGMHLASGLRRRLCRWADAAHPRRAHRHPASATQLQMQARLGRRRQSKRRRNSSRIPPLQQQNFRAKARAHSSQNAARARGRTLMLHHLVKHDKDRRGRQVPNATQRIPGHI